MIGVYITDVFFEALELTLVKRAGGVQTSEECERGFNTLKFGILVIL